MKIISEQVVKETAIELIQSNQVTTTLDVKNELRNQGYQVIQSEVSQLMKQLADQGILSFTISGIHRLYELGPNNQITGDLDEVDN